MAQSGRVVSLDDRRSSIASERGPRNELDEVMFNFFGRTISKKWYFLGLVAVLNVILYSDQNLLAPVLTPVALDYGWVETYPNGTVILEFNENLGEFVEKVDGSQRDRRLGGDITLVFFVGGGTLSLIGGYLADIGNRRNLLAGFVVLGETFCLLTFWLGRTYWGLFATRAATGVAIGAVIPLSFSLFSDLFHESDRGKAVAAAGLASGIGIGAGQILAGIISGPDGSNWRYAFLAVSVPAFLVVPILLLTVKEPPRGQRETAFQDIDSPFVYDESISWAKVKKLLKTPTVVLVYLQGIPGSIPWGALLIFFNDFLIEEKNVKRATSSLVIVSFGIGAAIGSIFGGFLADRWVNRKKLLCFAAGVSTAIAVFPLLGFVWFPPLSLGVYLPLGLPAGALAGMSGSIVRTILINVSSPEVRGTAFAVFALFDDVGKAAGAFIVSIIIEAVGDRSTGLAISVMLWWVAAVVQVAIGWFVEKDYDDTQLTLEQLIKEGRIVVPPI